MSRYFRRNGRLYLIDDAGVLWLGTPRYSGLGDLGAWDWNNLGKIIETATTGVANIIAAKKTGIAPIGGGGGGTGAGLQLTDSKLRTEAQLDIKTIALWGGLGLLAIMLFKRIAK